MKKLKVLRMIALTLVFAFSCGNILAQGGFKVMPGTDITVETGTTLNVAVGKLLLKDDLNSSPSFLEKGTLAFSGSGEAYIEQYLSQDAWHIVSPSVSNEVNGAFMWMYLYSYTEADNSWAYMNQPTNQVLYPGQGYFVWSYTTDPNGIYPPSPDSVVLNGTLNKADVSLTLSNTDSSPKSGWNLLGNPYPCAIDWNGNWTSTNVAPTIYLFDAGAGNGNYQTWNWNTGLGTNGKSNGNIAAGQGFWVRAADTTGAATSITIPQAERLHSSQPFLKSSWGNLLRLNVASGYGSDETVICFNEEASTGFDTDLDAWHIMGNDEAPALYTALGNDSYAVNFLPEMQSVPLNFRAIQPGSYTVSASGMASFAADVPIWLEDTKEGVFHDLRQNPEYGFTASPIDAPGRFFVHFYNPLGINDPNTTDMVNIYAYGKTVYVNMPAHDGYCVVYDMMGNKATARPLALGINKIPAAFNQGFYLVTVNMPNGKMMTEKVFIK